MLEMLLVQIGYVRLITFLFFSFFFDRVLLRNFGHELVQFGRRL